MGIDFATPVRVRSAIQRKRLTFQGRFPRKGEEVVNESRDPGKDLPPVPKKIPLPPPAHPRRHVFIGIEINLARILVALAVLITAIGMAFHS
jgi:hypothetical protein